MRENKSSSLMSANALRLFFAQFPTKQSDPATPENCVRLNLVRVFDRREIRQGLFDSDQC